MQAVNIWLIRNYLKHMLAPEVKHVPLRARVMARVVEFENLRSSHGVVGTVSSDFNHEILDQVI